MKPIKISGFLVVILTVILLVPYFVSVPEVKVFTFTIRLPRKSDPTREPVNRYKDISELKKLLADSVPVPEKSAMKPLSRTLKTKADTLKTDTSSISALKDTLKKVIQPLEFPPGGDTLLIPFFETLQSIDESSKLVRILHYGDSQIEADRITSYFRNQMQSKFGGAGVGFIPVTPVNPASISYVFETSPNWNRHSILNTKKKDEDPDYGLLGAFSRFSNRESAQDNEKEAWIYLKNPNISYSRAWKYKRCKLLLAGNKNPLFIELKKDETVIDADIFPSGNSLRVVDWAIETGVRNLLITFKGKDSPDLYGIALDGERGIAVDNIPLRGSSGLEFTRIFRSPYHTVLNKLNVKLIILQFGVNAVINMSDNISYYEKSFGRQLALLRRMQPNIPVIVIGVNDISKNTPEGYVTREGVEEIRDAQRRAAFDAGCIFWDMYEGMGGENSMPSWVFAKPALAQKDFLHFNALGARIMGEMFYRSLMNEYNTYLEKKQQP